MKNGMFAVFSAVLAASLTLCAYAEPDTPPPSWRAAVIQQLPLLGHRNWILIVDSAYPLQTSPGIETVDTGAGQPEVAHFVLEAIRRSVHVRPVIYLDAELPYVPEEAAPGVSAYRTEINRLLQSYPVEPQLHEKLIANVDEISKSFHVLVLKTNLTIPYSSVFIRLDCKYWGAEDEKQLRLRMSRR